MKNQDNQLWKYLLLTIIFLFGVFSSVCAQKSIGADYGARAPRVCKDTKNPTKGAPSAAQAELYVACEREGIQAKMLYLVEEVKVEIGAGRPFSINSDPFLTDADTNSPVYPIRGSFKEYQCEPQVNNPGLPQYNNVGKNCTLRDNPKATGKCWKTTFGDWRCDMTSDTQDTDPKRNVPPPGGAKPAATAPAPETQPAANNTAAGNNTINQTATANGNAAQNTTPANGDDSGFPVPETSEMSPYFDVLKYKYELNQGYLVTTVKTKSNSADRPHNGWIIHYYDEDGIEIWQIGMLELNSNLNTGQTETFRAPLPRESDLKRTKRVVVTKYVN